MQRSWLSRAVAGALSLSLLLQVAPSAAEEMSIAFPASADPEIRRAQQTMVESWAYVQALYLDPSFSHTDWAQALQDSLAASFKASSAAEVSALTDQLLVRLDDPFTRLLQGADAAALEAQEEGKIVATGLGLQQVLLLPHEGSTAATTSANTAAAPALATALADTAALEISSAPAAAAAAATGQEALVVSFVVEGSPAAAAGVGEGDLLLSVGSQPVSGQELRQVYKLLSKESDVTLLRQQPASSGSSDAGSSTVQGVLPIPQLASFGSGTSTSTSNGSSNSSSDAVLAAAVAAGYSSDAYTVHLTPQPLEFAPVEFGTIDIDKAVASASAASTYSANTSSSSDSGNITSTAVKVSNSSSSSSDVAGLQDVGYLKLLSFSATAPQEVAQALVDMQYESEAQHGGHGLAGIILDLRDNPGGLVEAGVSIAQDFLQQGQVLCIALDRSGQEERVVLPAAHTLTQLPLVLLVNHSTASTSELLAGSLHDELSAPLIGTTTYGKGRTQRVVQLADGSSTLLVSTLQYFTPKHTEIDKVGLQPDVVCEPPVALGTRWAGGRVEDGQQQGGLSLLEDPCVKLAAEKLIGRTL